MSVQWRYDADGRAWVQLKHNGTIDVRRAIDDEYRWHLTMFLNGRWVSKEGTGANLEAAQREAMKVYRGLTE